jgi:hypothetical protein
MRTVLMNMNAKIAMRKRVVEMFPDADADKLTEFWYGREWMNSRENGRVMASVLGSIFGIKTR